MLHRAGKKKGWDEHIFSVLQLEIEFAKICWEMILSCLHFASKCGKLKLEIFISFYLIVNRAKKGTNFEQRWRFVLLKDL